MFAVKEVLPEQSKVYLWLSGGNILNVVIPFWQRSADLNKAVYILMFTMIAACSPAPAPKPDVIPWGDAMRLYCSWEVTAVFQAHSLAVGFETKDGSTFHSVEPYIDAIYYELPRCDRNGEVQIITE